jgi:hypothetical protein
METPSTGSARAIAHDSAGTVRDRIRNIAIVRTNRTLARESRHFWRNPAQIHATFGAIFPIVARKENALGGPRSIHPWILRWSGKGFQTGSLVDQEDAGVAPCTHGPAGSQRSGRGELRVSLTDRARPTHGFRSTKKPNEGKPVTVRIPTESLRGGRTEAHEEARAIEAIGHPGVEAVLLEVGGTIQSPEDPACGDTKRRLDTHLRTVPPFGHGPA